MVHRFFTLWRPHTAGFIVGGALIIMAAAGIAVIATTFQPRTDLSLGTGSFSVQVADTNAARVQGLSGVESLGPNEGLLMVFDTPGKWSIWMKDMKVPLDIIWLNDDKEVVHIVKNASPDLGTSKTFAPMKPARYVVELPAGTAEMYNIRIGEDAVFVLADEDV